MYLPFGLLAALFLVSATATSTLDSRSALGTWTPLAPIARHKRQEHTTVALNSSHLYVLGGILPEDTSGNLFPTITLMQAYSIPLDKWITVAPVPAAYNHPNAAVVDGKIYLLGALTPGAPATWVAASACYVYDPVKDKWTFIGDMPNGRGSAAVAVRKKTM